MVFFWGASFHFLARDELHKAKEEIQALKAAIPVTKLRAPNGSGFEIICNVLDVICGLLMKRLCSDI